MANYKESWTVFLKCWFNHTISQARWNLKSLTQSTTLSLSGRIFASHVAVLVLECTTKWNLILTLCNCLLVVDVLDKANFLYIVIVYILFFYKKNIAYVLWVNYSKPCLIRHLCNRFPCVNRRWFSFIFDNFNIYFFNCVIRHPVYLDTKFLSHCVSD